MIQPPGSLRKKYQSTISLWYTLMSMTSTNRMVRLMIQAAVYEHDKFQSTFECMTKNRQMFFFKYLMGLKRDLKSMTSLWSSSISEGVGLEVRAGLA